MATQIRLSQLVKGMEQAGVIVVNDLMDENALPETPTKPKEAAELLKDFRSPMSAAILRNWRLQGFLSHGEHYYDCRQPGAARPSWRYNPRAIALKLKGPQSDPTVPQEPETRLEIPGDLASI